MSQLKNLIDFDLFMYLYRSSLSYLFKINLVQGTVGQCQGNVAENVNQKINVPNLTKFKSSAK